MIPLSLPSASTDNTTEASVPSSSTSIDFDSTIILPNYDDSLVYNFVESRQYKAALALNNIGVSLVEGGAYRDALTTFQRAFELVRDITTITTSTSSKR